jgi:molybdopterin synthase catalytic subunit
MARKSTEENIVSLERAQAVARSGITHMLLDQADELVDRAVFQHRNGKLSDRDAAVVIATVSELRSAANKAQQIFIKGIEAGEALTQGTAS